MTESTSSNASSQDDKGPTILAIMWSLTGITTLFVIARIYTRFKILKAGGPDDYLIVISLCIGYLFVSLTTVSVDAGIGKHSSTLSTKEFEKAVMFDIAGFAPGVFSFVVPKMAIVVLLIRIFNPTKKTKIFLWALVGTSGLFILGCVVILYAQCSPAKAMWTPTLEHYTCWNPWILVDYAIVAGAISGLVDLILAIYPSTVLRKLHIEKKKKIGLCAALGLGIIACAITVYKCTRLPSLTDKNDYTYSTADLVIWTNIESNAVIIGSCIPTIAPLIEQIIGRPIFTSSRGGRPVYSSGGRHHDSGPYELKNNSKWTRVKDTKDDVESQTSILRES